MIKLVNRGYITEGEILCLMSFLSGTKGTEDISIFSNVTISRLNNSLWAPDFMLPSMGSFLMLVGPQMHMLI